MLSLFYYSQINDSFSSPSTSVEQGFADARRCFPGVCNDKIIEVEVSTGFHLAESQILNVNGYRVGSIALADNGLKSVEIHCHGFADRIPNTPSLAGRTHQLSGSLGLAQCQQVHRRIWGSTPLESGTCSENGESVLYHSRWMSLDAVTPPSRGTSRGKT